MSDRNAQLFSDADRRFMQAALELAEKGRGAVEPNPMVGAIIVRDGRQIGRGRHERFGGPHAEIEAIRSAQAAGEPLAGSTIYVTLEPCCHHGKTPPCTEAIGRAQIARVVVAMEDPDEKVAGQGIAQLRQAGVSVDVGACNAEARKLLAAYRKLRTNGRPWVICKWAQTADGFLALGPGAGRWISGEAARNEVHRIRSLCDGVCVGIETVLADDPLLTNRSGGGRQPVRLVLDSDLRLPVDSQLVRTAGQSPVLVATNESAMTAQPTRAEGLREAGVELLALPGSPQGQVDLGALLDELGKRQWTYLLVEGGARVLDSFIAGGEADELLVFVAPFEAPAEARNLARYDISQVAQTMNLGQCQEASFGPDRLLRYVLTD